MNTARSGPAERLAGVIRTHGPEALARVREAPRTRSAPAERAVGQGGDAPRQVDRELHSYWKTALEASGFLVLGEEADDVDVWAAVKARPGAALAVIDPVDGTSNLVQLGWAWAISVVAYQPVGDSLLLIGVSIVQSDGTHIWGNGWFTKRGTLSAPLGADVELLSAPPAPSARRAWSVAGVGAKQGRTRQFLNLITEKYGIRTYSLGGTPLASALLEHELTALVELQATTVFDAAHLVLANPLDVVIGTVDGTVLAPLDVLDLFQRVRRSQERVVPPYIVAKDADVYRELVDIHAWATRS